MHQYSVRDVERLVHLPRRRIRSLIEAGFVQPQRGPRNSWRFSFQDVIVLRNAQALAAAKVPRKRIAASVKELRRRFPQSTPLSGLNLSADSGGVVVKEGNRRWRAESGQYLLGFESAPSGGAPKVLERQAARPPEGADDWFERGVALESADPEGAIDAYERAVAADPALLKARINLGCLLHEKGRLEKAEAVYRDALRAHGDDPVLLFDIGVLLDDRGRRLEAAEAYRAALRRDPAFADCHFNLALLCERLGRPKDAIQHLAAYRRLTSASRSE